MRTRSPSNKKRAPCSSVPAATPPPSTHVGQQPQRLLPGGRQYGTGYGTGTAWAQGAVPLPVASRAVASGLSLECACCLASADRVMSDESRAPASATADVLVFDLPIVRFYDFGGFCAETMRSDVDCRFLLWRAGQQIIYECASARRHMQRAGHLSWAHVSSMSRIIRTRHMCATTHSLSHVNSRSSPSQRAELGAIQEVDGLNAYAVSAMPDAAA